MKRCTAGRAIRRHVRALTAAVCCCVCVTAARAPADTSTNDTLFDLSLTELMQVKITSASLFDSDTLTIGSTVRVLERSDWQRLGARRTLDAIRHHPATLLVPSLYGLDVIAVRGYAQIGSARGIATLLDGIPLNGPVFGSGQYLAQNIGLGVLDRMEFIHGPGSALYGSDAFHGVLSMSAFESDEDMTAVSAEGGMNDYYRAGVRHSVGIGSGTRLNLAFAAVGEERSRAYRASDLVTMSPREFHPDERYRSQTGSLKLLLDPTPRLKVLCGLYLDNFETWDYPGSVKTVSDSYWNSRSLAAQIKATREIGWDNTLEARIYHVDNYTPRDVIRPYGPLDVVDQHGTSDERRSGAALTFRRPSTDNRNTQFAIALGYEQAAFDDGTTKLTPLSGAFPPDVDDFPGSGESRTIWHGLLDARTVLPDERWSVIYGGRLDEYSDVGFHATPRLGVIFQPVDDTAVKLLYNNAFRAPTFGERYSTEIPGALDLEPETLDSYELVFLKQGDRWTAEIVLFENRWEDGISIVPAESAAGFTYANTGKNEARGVEVSLTWVPRPWRFDLSGSYVESRNSAMRQDYDRFPKTKLSVSIGRELAFIDTEVYVHNHLFDEVKDLSTSATLGTPEYLPTYWRTDLTLRKELSPGLYLFANVINLFDRDNRYPSVLGFPGGVPDRPLTVSAGIRYRL